MTSRICVNKKEEFEDTKGVIIIHKSKKNFVVGSHNITLLDGLPTEIIKKNAKVSVYEPVVLRTLEGTQ